MNRYFSLASYLSRTKTICVLLAAYGLFILLVMPKLAGESATPPIDLAFHYSPSQVYEWIEAYGEAGRVQYMIGEMTLDILYPLIYTGLFVGLLGFFTGLNTLDSNSRPIDCKRNNLHYAVVIPPFIGFFDLLENIGIVTMLSNYPERLDSIARLSAWATSIKWSLALIVIIITVSLGLRYALHVFKKVK